MKPQIAKCKKIILDCLDEELLSGVECIYLFGSRARGDAEERSDIDIAILCPDKDKAAWFALLAAIEQAETLLEIDVVNFSEAAQTLQQRILDEGIKIYDASEISTKS